MQTSTAGLAPDLTNMRRSESNEFERDAWSSKYPRVKQFISRLLFLSRRIATAHTHNLLQFNLLLRSRSRSFEFEFVIDIAFIRLGHDSSALRSRREVRRRNSRDRAPEPPQTSTRTLCHGAAACLLLRCHPALCCCCCCCVCFRVDVCEVG